MGGPSVPGVGWAGGIDRLAMMLKDENVPKKLRPLAIIPMDESYDMQGLELASKIRDKGWTTQMTYGGNLGKRMKKANKMEAVAALILGEEEVKTQTVTLKNLDTGDQVRVSQSDLDKTLQEKGFKPW
jgi:histidyl-tRNA synthetase